MNNIWDSIKNFLKNLGHTILSDIMTALPEAEQILMASIQTLVEAAIAYVEQKYATQMSLNVGVVMTAVDKLALDNQRHNDAFNYVKEEMTKNPTAYSSDLRDSLIHCYIELEVQKAKRLAEGNHGNGFQGK